MAPNRFDETMNVIVAFTLSVQIAEKEKKLTYIFIFTLLCGGLKAFWGTTKKCENKNFKAHSKVWDNFWQLKAL